MKYNPERWGFRGCAVGFSVRSFIAVRYADSLNRDPSSPRSFPCDSGLCENRESNDIARFYFTKATAVRMKSAALNKLK
jgi:hypothetical protein